MFILINGKYDAGLGPIRPYSEANEVLEGEVFGLDKTKGLCLISPLFCWILIPFLLPDGIDCGIKIPLSL